MHIAIILCSLICAQVFAWEDLPEIPTGRRSQYFALNENGGYKYGFDTGDGFAGKQSGDASNQVEGHYFYKDAYGQDIDLKYSAGVQGFVPGNLENLQAKPTVTPSATSTTSNYYNGYINGDNSNEEANSGDASYNFNIDTDTYKRQENSDARGNIQGSYSYTNNVGTHDLTYKAGEDTGFVAVSGSLSKPNGLNGAENGKSPSPPSPSGAPGGSYPFRLSDDGSYSFGYSTDDQSRNEESDAKGNVRGSYSYRNNAGSHDLSYEAGSATGFKVTGGSLSKPNGLNGDFYDSLKTKSYTTAHTPYLSPEADGSYSFAFSTEDQSRSESADSNGNVKGSYSFRNGAGYHDFKYEAGAESGFRSVGGSLSKPNGLTNSNGNGAPSSPISYSGPNSDGSYSFEFSTDDQSRSETGDSEGNVRGRYSYKNDAGSHDLTYEAGSQTGFKATGGSLSVPNGLGNLLNGNESPSGSDQSDDNQGSEDSSGDASYSFNIDTNDYKRQESADANGNVKGQFSYENSAGRHDLSYIAGSDTGFVATGGSLSVPNGLTNKSLKPKDDDESNTGDASYNFSIDTDDYKRLESSDSQGNIKGSYSYKNAVGNHDLNYVAGTNTGFIGTGGSLSIPPGLSESQFGPQSHFDAATSPASSPASDTLPQSKSSYSLGNIAVRTYLPPNNEKRKYGYIFDTKY